MSGIVKAHRLSRKVPGIEFAQRQSDALPAFHFPADPPQLSYSVGVEAESLSRLKRDLAQQVDRSGGVKSVVGVSKLRPLLPFVGAEADAHAVIPWFEIHVRGFSHPVFQRIFDVASEIGRAHV